MTEKKWLYVYEDDIVKETKYDNCIGRDVIHLTCKNDHLRPASSRLVFNTQIGKCNIYSDIEINGLSLIETNAEQTKSVFREEDLIAIKEKI